MRVKTLLQTLSYIILGMWVLSVFPIIVFPNIHAMAKYMGNELANITLYVFALGWMVPFALLIDEPKKKGA